jgi:predicted transcriptional regulator
MRRVFASKEIGLEVNTEKTKYMIMSRDQSAGKDHNMKRSNKSFERVEHFAYLGTTLKNLNCSHEEIKSRWKRGNACYHSVQNIFFTSLLSKKYK